MAITNLNAEGGGK